MPEGTFFEKIERIKKSYRILVFLLTIFVLAALFVYFVYLPKTGEISNITDDISHLKQRLVVAKKRAKNLAKFEEEQARVDARFREALKLLPNEREIPSLLGTVSQLGRESDLEFQLFSPQKENSQDFYIEIPVAIEVNGNYHNVATFFSKVGRMERIVNILDVSMKPEKELSTDLKTRCTAVTYRFKSKADEEKEKSKKKKKKK